MPQDLTAENYRQTMLAPVRLRRPEPKPRSPSPPIRQRTKRILAISAVTIAAGVLTHYAAHGLLAAAVTCQVVPNVLNGSTLECPDTSDAVGAMAILGAISGFWFAYTGRLARLFQKI